MPSTTTSQFRLPADPPCLGSALLHAIWAHAHQYPNAVAVAEVDANGRTLTYLQLATAIRQRACALSAVMQSGDILLAVLPAGTDYVVDFCAALAAGVRFLPMHPQVAGPEAAVIAQRIDARYAVVAPDMPATGSLAHLQLSLPSSDAVGDDNGELGREARMAGAVVLGSSGTTGLPKLAVRESRALDADAAAVIAGMNLTRRDRVLFATPLSHSYGVDVLVGVLTAGATLRILPKFDAVTMASEMESSATVLAGVPFMFEALARVAPRTATSLRLALSAGSRLLPRVAGDFFASWGLPVGQLYGATELGTVATNLPGTPGFDSDCIGRPLPGVSMRVVDPASPHRVVSVGQEGHLLVRTPSMLSCYLDADLPLVDGHLLTGDLARIDAQGRVWITGRLKLLIDVGAYKVNPLEVEMILAQCPDVAECVVVPVQASDTLQRVRAVVVPRDRNRPPSTESLRRFLRERLSAIKVPRVIDLVDSLPKTPTGKVQRDLVIGRMP